MSGSTDLYDSHYGRVEAAVYRAVRDETYDEDLGQTGWLNASECDDFARWLDVGPASRVLEVACGSGGVSVRLAERLGANVVGVDVNEAAVAAATARADARGVAEEARFVTANADEPLPFDDASFDAIFCNDAINHFEDRAAVLREWHRVLAPGGRLLYTDPIVVTGCLSNAEIATRSAIGFFLFTPAGANEQLLREAGFDVVRVEDVTGAVAHTAKRWHDARATRQAELLALESAENFERLQRFLATVHVLAAEGRLSRFAFLSPR